MLDRSSGAGQHCIDSGELGIKGTAAVISVHALPCSGVIGIRFHAVLRGAVVSASSCYSRAGDEVVAAKGAEAGGRQGPAGRPVGDAAAGFQDIAGDGQLVGRAAESRNPSCTTRSSRCTSPPSIYSEAQASAKWERSTKPSPTGERGCARRPRSAQVTGADWVADFSPTRCENCA